MALTMAGYIHRRVEKSVDFVPTDLRDLEIIKPLIAEGTDAKKQQVLRITATTERPLKSVKFSYNSISRDGSVGDLHASCIVQYKDARSLLAQWSRLDYVFRSRIDVLAQCADAGKYKKVSREQAYEAFSSLVQYDKKFHGMKEVILDSKNFEATSLIEFRATENDGDFEANPYWIDNVTHLSGFVLNGSGGRDPGKQVYISHGWESLQLLRPLSARKVYRNHVKMHPSAKQTMSGDVYVYDGDDMVALVGAVKFQAIPRSLLNKLLPPVNEATSNLEPQASPWTKGPAGQPKGEIPQAEEKRAPVSNERNTKASTSTTLPQNANRAITGFMDIISKELGLELSELHDTVAFSDIGLDSLMSLTVTGRMREELELDVPTSLFTDKPTIGEAKIAILALDGGNLKANAFDDSASANSAGESDTSGDNTTQVTSTGTDMPKYPVDKLIEKLFSTVSEELGIEESELFEMANFADLGVDSLMSLSITGRIREELDLDVPTSFFTDYPTVSEAKTAVYALVGRTTSGSGTPSSYIGYSTPDGTDTPQDNHRSNDPNLTDLLESPRGNDHALRPAKSVLLSGSPRTASKTLFLFPDGSGSVTSYSSLPSISSNICVYGFDCPFMKSPEDYTRGIDSVAGQYLAGVKKRQSEGPYFLGGWSACGVIAYQVAYKLLEMGEKTERLFLIDSPCPINLEPLPSSLLHFIDSLGMFGTQIGSAPPMWLMPHFEASIRNLSAFIPNPMDPMVAPKTLVIWACDGLLKDPMDKRFPRSHLETKSVKFLLDSRGDFGSYGWDNLLGEENIITTHVQGNHFTMVREPYVSIPQGMYHSRAC